MDDARGQVAGPTATDGGLIVAIPSSATVLPGVATAADPRIAALRADVAAALAHVSASPATSAATSGGLEVVVVAPDALVERPTVLVPADGVVHLGGLGLADQRVTLHRVTLDRVAPETAQDGAGRSADVGGSASDVGRSALHTATDHPRIDLSVLAVTVAGAVPEAELALLAVPPALGGRADPPGLVDLSGLADLVEARWPGATIVVAADLAAGHGPKPPRPAVGSERTAAFDDAVLAALDQPDLPAALHDGAAAVGSRGLSALGLASHLATRRGLRPSLSRLHRAGGVGGLVAVWSR